MKSYVEEYFNSHLRPWVYEEERRLDSTLEILPEPYRMALILRQVARTVRHQPNQVIWEVSEEGTLQKVTYWLYETLLDSWYKLGTMTATSGGIVLRVNIDTSLI